MTRHLYQASFDIDVGAAIPSVGEVLTSVNNTMHSFGFPEKLCLMSNAKIMDITSDRPLLTAEIEIIVSKLREACRTDPIFKKLKLNFTELNYCGIVRGGG